MDTSAPSGLTYIPNFITLEQESKLVQFLHSQTWDSSEIKRETQHFGTKYKYNKSSMSIVVPPIPQEFQFLMEKMVEYGSFDQAIVNRYQIGEGIGAHIDDPKLYDDVVVSISLLSDIPMIFTNRKQKRYFIQTLERFSAVILQKESRYEWTHCIKPAKSDNGIPRQERISITFRKMRHIEQKRKQI
jgi:alkylated DNA repair dioxygenase AlkB